MNVRFSRKRYLTLEEAAAAACALGITNSIDYQTRYKEDPLLPSEPKSYYADWLGWNDFFGKPETKHYDSVKEASMAAIALGIETIAEYEVRYKEDPKLPSNPHRTYRTGWLGYPVFFGRDPRSFYATYSEASAAAKALNIGSYAEYMKRYREDPLLTSFPNVKYSSDWIDWYSFLGLKRKNFYESYEEARRVTQLAGATTLDEYAELARKNPRLPCSPKDVYKSDWQGWRSFLAPTKPRFYESYSAAQQAVRAMGIANGSEYRLRYKEDSKLPSVPRKVYTEEWSGWRDFLGTEGQKRADQLASEGNSFAQQLKDMGKRREPPYESFDEAAEAARALGVLDRRSYEKSFSVDPRLRSYPQTIYASSWRGWTFFLSGIDDSCYPTYEEAKRAVRALNIRNSREYRVRYREDPRLPSNPHEIYRDRWESFPAFTGAGNRRLYKRLEDAARAAQALGIKSSLDYRRRFKEDPMLPHSPATVYSSEWKSWHVFLGKDEPKFHSTYSKAKKAARRLRIRSSNDYKRRYKEDPMLPSNPNLAYSEDWSGWASFLNSDRTHNRATGNNAR